jgi:glycosyltransferase involved in cell wall biosynthesis
MSHISICFAVYQNQGAITSLYQQIVHELNTHFPYHTYELLFVNDGSKDGSLDELLALREIDNRVKIISFSRNFGQMAAILAGWEKATGDCVINMAADMQDPPEQCTLMIKEWEKGSDIVISYRAAHETSISNKLTSKFFYKLMLPDAPPGGFDFTLLDRKPMNALNSLKERHRFYQYDILWAGFIVKYLPYHKLERRIGKSQYNFYKRFGNFYSGFLNVSYLPLRLMTAIGGVMAFLGFVYSISIIRAYFAYRIPFQGWAPIMIMILVVGGLIILMLGMIGEYIWRILDEVKGRPNYIVKEFYE